MAEKIDAIKEELTATPTEALEAFVEKYASDSRTGVQKLVDTAKKRMDKLQKEMIRTENLKKYEKEYDTYTYICGIDEVGRGPLAGPVVAGAVILPKDCDILYINDSKKLSAAKREELYDIIMEQAVATGLGTIGPDRIDEINILQATYEAMRQAIAQLSPQPDLLLNDAVTIPKVTIPQVPIIKGDAKSISIGAASIIAKVTRDRMMVYYDSIRSMVLLPIKDMEARNILQHSKSMDRHRFTEEPLLRILYHKIIIQNHKGGCSDADFRFGKTVSSGDLIRCGDADRDERCGKSCGLSAVSDKRKYF